MKAGFAFTVCLTIAGALAALAPGQQPPMEKAPQPPVKPAVEVGRELSAVGGVSLYRLPDQGPRFGFASVVLAPRHIKTSGTLPEILKQITDLPPSHIQGSDLLPEGNYQVNARTRRGPARALLFQVMGQAFHLRITLATRDTEILVLTRGANLGARDGFQVIGKRLIKVTSSFRTSTTRDGVKYNTQQISMDSAAFVSLLEKITKRPVLDETRISGRLQGQFSFRDDHAVSDLQQSLAGKGLILTATTRPMEMLTIEPAK